MTDLDAASESALRFDPITPDALTVSSVKAAFERLPEQFRVAVLLVDAEGLTYREAADAMDGHELIKRVRALPDADLRETPAAALTAFARSEDRTKALQSGFEMHLSKPVDPAELVASVAMLVRRTRTAR